MLKHQRQESHFAVSDFFGGALRNSSNMPNGPYSLVNRSEIL